MSYIQNICFAPGTPYAEGGVLCCSDYVLQKFKNSLRRKTLQYTATERVIREKITEEYHIDGVTHRANLITHGKGGMYEHFNFRNRRATIELEDWGEIRVTFPHTNMLDLGKNIRPARFTEYAEKKLEEAVQIFSSISKDARDKGFIVDQLNLTIHS